MEPQQASASPTATPAVIAFVTGAVLWFGVAVLSGKREAWDSGLYWALAYPIALLVCAYLGHAFPDRPWRWALVLFQAQLLAMCVRNGEFGSLLPLGVVMFAVIALPGMALAMLVARRSGRFAAE